MIIYGIIFSVRKVYEEIYKRLKELLPIIKYPRFHIYLMKTNKKFFHVKKLMNGLFDSTIYNYFRTHLLTRHSGVLNSLALEKVKFNLTFEKYQ